MAHETDAASALRAEWAEALAEQGVAGPHVDAVLHKLLLHLQRQHGGTELYIPVMSREYPVEAIREAFARRDSVRTICRRFQVDRRTLYRLLDIDSSDSGAGNFP